MGKIKKRRQRTKKKRSHRPLIKIPLFTLTQEEHDAIYAANPTPQQDELLKNVAEKYPFLIAPTQEAMLLGMAKHTGLIH